MAEPRFRKPLQPAAGIDVVNLSVREAVTVLSDAGYRKVRWLFQQNDVTDQTKYVNFFVESSDHIQRGVITSTDTQVTLTLVSALPGSCDPGFGGNCPPDDDGRGANA